MVDEDAVERRLVGPGLESRVFGLRLSLELFNVPRWGSGGEVVSTIEVSVSSRSSLLPTRFAARNDLVRLGVGVPGTSKTIAFKKSSDSNRGDVKVGGLVGRMDVSTNLTFSLERT